MINYAGKKKKNAGTVNKYQIVTVCNNSNWIKIKYIFINEHRYVNDIRIRSRFRTHQRLQFLSPPRVRTVFKKEKEKEKRIKKLGQVRDAPVRRKSKVDFLNGTRWTVLSFCHIASVLSCEYPSNPSKSIRMEKADILKYRSTYLNEKCLAYHVVQTVFLWFNKRA